MVILPLLLIIACATAWDKCNHPQRGMSFSFNEFNDLNFWYRADEVGTQINMVVTTTSMFINMTLKSTSTAYFSRISLIYGGDGEHNNWIEGDYVLRKKLKGEWVNATVESNATIDCLVCASDAGFPSISQYEKRALIVLGLLLSPMMVMGVGLFLVVFYLKNYYKRKMYDDDDFYYKRKMYADGYNNDDLKEPLMSKYK